MKEKSIHILIVDDHNLFRKSLSNLIHTFKFLSTIYEAANGLEALEIISSNLIDIVLLDVQMPVMNGVDTIKQIKKVASKPRVIYNGPQK
jgi:YesN/AraC family two-component response regulator